MESIQKLHSLTNNRHSLTYFIVRLVSSKRAFRIILFISLALWCFAFSFNSLFSSSIEAAITYPFLKKLFHLICHQLKEKSFSFNGVDLLVCARCTGIYLGALLSSIASLFYTKRLSLNLKLLYISFVPMLIDVTFTTLNIYSYSKILSFFTGLFFGSIVFIYILTAIENNFTYSLFNE